jgi:predicted transcriptional regulator
MSATAGPHLVLCDAAPSVTIAAAIRKGRTEARLTQAELAKRIGSRQARVAKMEGDDPQPVSSP